MWGCYQWCLGPSRIEYQGAGRYHTIWKAFFFGSRLVCNSWFRAVHQGGYQTVSYSPSSGERQKCSITLRFRLFASNNVHNINQNRAGVQIRAVIQMITSCSRIRISVFKLLTSCSRVVLQFLTTGSSYEQFSEPVFLW